MTGASDGVLYCGKYKNKSFSEIAELDKGYCSWVLSLDECAGSLADFQIWLQTHNKRTSTEAKPNAKKSRISEWLESSLCDDLDQLAELDRMTTSSSTGGPSSAARPLPASMKDDRNALITYSGTLLLEVCSQNSFRVICKDSGSNRFSTFLPRELFTLLTPYRIPGQSQLAFKHSEYGRILQLLNKTVRGPNRVSDIESIPLFVLLAFEDLRKFATQTKLSAKTANIISGRHSPISRAIMDESGRMKQLVGTSLLDNLRKFQVEGLHWGLKKNGRCLIGDEMGLGKTLQALAIAALYQDEWPVLVVCPSSIRFQWRDQARKWLQHLFRYPEVEVAVVNTAKFTISPYAKFIITSYDMLIRCDALKTGFKVIVCDESHYLKSLTAKRSKILVPMLQSAKRAILLSGTPALNKPVELYQQMIALLPNLTTYKIFAERYCDKRKNSWNHKFDYYGSRLSEELNVLLRSSVMIRRLKKDVEKELPAKLRSCIPIELPADKLEMIKLKMRSMKGGEMKGTEEEADEGRAPNAKERHMQISEVFKTTGEAKASYVCDYIKEILLDSECGEGEEMKMLIFAHHQSVMNIIEAQCLSGRRYIRIDGSTPMASRESLVKKFQESQEADIALLSITACGHGLNLTKARLGIFAELYWVPGQIIQAEDRLHRIGTEHKTVNIHYCIADGTLDHVVWSTLVRKWQDVSATINGEVESLAMASSH